MDGEGTGLVAEWRALLGERGCLTEPLEMQPYLEDWRGLSKDAGRALCVARPESTEQVARIVARCAETGTAIVPQGGVTGLVKASAPDGARPMLVLSMDRMNRVIEVDALNQAITLEAGCILQDAQIAATASGLRLPLRIGSEGSCRIGGNLSTNAGGNFTIRYGNARDLCLGLEVVLPDGRVLDELKVLRKDNTGYDLKHLFLGAEGTLGVITKAVLRLVPAPRQSATVLVGLPRLAGVFDLLQRFRERAGDHLSVFELLPGELLAIVLRHMPQTRDPLAASCPWYALIEVETAQSDPDLEALVADVLGRALDEDEIVDGTVAHSESQAAELRRLREVVSEAQKLESYSAKHDVAVPVARVVEFIERGTELVRERVPDGRTIAFGHVGDGNIHFNIQAPLGDHAAERLRALVPSLADEVHALAVSLGGTFSAEHGIGRIKREAFRHHRPLKHALGRDIKRWLDPDGIMNPGVLFER